MFILRYLISIPIIKRICLGTSAIVPCLLGLKTLIDSFNPPLCLPLHRTESICNTSDYKADAIIVAGDVSDDMDTLKRTLELLKSAFQHVFYTPGNHDLWVRRTERGHYDSLGKLQKVQNVCDSLNVYTRPARCGGVWIFPLISWYHASWDREPDVLGATPIEKVMLDFHVCTWTSTPGLSTKDESIARHLDSLNEPAFSAALNAIEEETRVSGVRPPVISFSHFLPHQTLLPEKRWLHFPNLAKACGSDFVASRIDKLSPMAHVYGHTHFSQDTVIDGVRYVQWPLGYPAEQKRRRNGGQGWTPLLLFNTTTGELSDERDCYWSAYYKTHSRQPHITG